MLRWNHLQSVLNAAARSIAGLRRSDHVTDTLASFHWLCATERINFNLAVLDRDGTAPRTALHLDTCLTFAALLTCLSRRRLYGRRLPANLMSARRVSSLSETVHLPLLDQSSGTVSLMTLHRPHRCQLSSN